MRYVAAPEMKRPAIDSFCTPHLGGKITLTLAQWSGIDTRVAKFGKLVT